MKHRIALALGAVVLVTAVAGAQSRPAFDVASLKPSPPAVGDKIYINLGTARHGMLTLSNACLADCLRYAYSITNNEQIAGPDWIKFKDVRFDIEAKAPPDTPLPRLREMLQTLLTERFKLEYHTTQKTMSYVALVVGRTVRRSWKPWKTRMPRATVSSRERSFRTALQWRCWSPSSRGFWARR